MAETSPSKERRRSLWSRAAAAAAKTPDSRNRYVDFLRALSITAVIFGHWLVTTAYFSDGQLNLGNMLEYQEWTKWLTWIFQVMPIFFLVGGYANGMSWSAAMRDGRSYKEWLNARLERLIGPVLPLLVVWALISALAPRLGVSPKVLAIGSQMAIVPAWFLAVYVIVVVLAPVSYAAWQRFGFGSFWPLVFAAAVDDVLFFSTGRESVGYFNFAFIWFAMHQRGYAWRDTRLAGLGKTLLWGLGGLALLIALVTVQQLPYPVHMAGKQGPVSNSFPPKLPMLALGIAQCGLLLSLEAPMRRWLERSRPWTATLLVNGMIMTIYLWHFTALTLVVGLAWLLANAGGTLGTAGLALDPASGVWWAARPVWMVLYLAALSALVLAFGRFERGRPGAQTAAAWRQVVGAALMCVGLALLAKDGIVLEGWLAPRTWVFLLPIAGAGLAGVLPFSMAKGRGASPAPVR